MFNPVYALVAALIWAFSPIYYKGFLEKFDFLSFNFLRMAMSSSVLLVPALLFGSGFGPGTGFAVISGIVTLGVGDSMFLLSIRETGASIAAPVCYVYVLMIQLVGVALGQVVPYGNVVAAVMVVAGVFILSRSGGGKPRAKGIAFAFAAAVAWTVGQELIQFATSAGGSILMITLTRNGSAAVALGVALLVTGRFRRWPSGLPAKQLGIISFFVLSDLVVGSLLFVYSISTIGVAVSVILTSVSPLLTQVFSRALGKEKPSKQDFAGGALIVAALVLAIGSSL
ncbi:MAG: DMT family transporter [Thaumarchaeota archaeon]|nr:DMT family transporter [Nitrososphaerota archaeon]